MALIKFGPMVVAARGTVAGITFSANKGGPYAKGWARGGNPQTEAQSSQRINFSGFAALWRELTQAERDDWDDYGAATPQGLTNPLGETYFASGFNWYIRINNHLFQADEAARDDAPTLTRPLAPIIETATFKTTDGGGTTAVRYTVADPDLTANHYVEARVYNSQGRNSAGEKFFNMVIEVPDMNRRVFMQDEIEAQFGEIIANQIVLFATSIQDAHGQRGPEDTIRRVSSA